MLPPCGSFFVVLPAAGSGSCKVTQGAWGRFSEKEFFIWRKILIHKTQLIRNPEAGGRKRRMIC